MLVKKSAGNLMSIIRIGWVLELVLEAELQLVVESLPSMCEALGSIPSTEKKKKEKIGWLLI
jgi:hypothetical protein